MSVAQEADHVLLTVWTNPASSRSAPGMMRICMITYGLTPQSRHATQMEPSVPTTSDKQVQNTVLTVACAKTSIRREFKNFLAGTPSVLSLVHLEILAPLATHLASMAGVPALQVAWKTFPSSLLKPPLVAGLGTRGALVTPTPLQLKC